MVKLHELTEGTVWCKSDVHRLIEAAACVANAIQGGAGACIQGTLMEKDLRQALKFKQGEFVEISKS